jgi:hypothetical protein
LRVSAGQNMWRHKQLSFLHESFCTDLLVNSHMIRGSRESESLDHPNIKFWGNEVLMQIIQNIVVDRYR